MPGDSVNVGLCLDCRHCATTRSDRGSIFYRCRLSKVNPALPKYPRLPVIACSGYKSKELESDESAAQ
jgi:hypothetical protein